MAAERPIHELSTGQSIAMALAFGIIGTLFGQYRYGFVNHLEQLPPIMRALDPGVMTGDQTVDELCTFGPRYYYVALIAGMARMMPVSAAYLLLTLLSHSGTALVTLLAARALFRSTLTAMISAALVVSVASVGIGGSAHLLRAQLVPQSLATPFLLAALWMAFQMRPWTAAGLAAAGCLFHPLAGAHTGMLALGTCTLAQWVSPSAGAAANRRIRAQRVLPTAAAGVLFAAFVYCAWILPEGDKQHDLQFMLDFARFRSPHHHLPSQFSLGVYAAFACFSAAILWAWLQWRAEPDTDAPTCWRVGVCLLAVYVLLLCGYVFVDVIPTRTFLMAQTFRLVFIVKWLGLMLLAAGAARMLTRPAPHRNVLAGVVMIAGTGPFQPGFALGGAIAEWAQRRILGRSVWTSLPVAALAGTAAVLLWQPECLNEVLALLGCGALIGWYWLNPPQRRSAGALAAVAACIGLVVIGRAQTAAGSEPLLGPYQPVLTLGDGSESTDAVADFVRDNLPADAVVLTPPYFGRFRIRAERGLIVDFKCTPYDARAYQEWRQRLRDCYGEVQGSTAEAVLAMRNSYITITPERIEHVARKYGAGYAVLLRETHNDWPALYQDDRFKLVAIPNVATARSNASVAKADRES